MTSDRPGPSFEIAAIVKTWSERLVESQRARRDLEVELDKANLTNIKLARAFELALSFLGREQKVALDAAMRVLGGERAS